LVYLFGLPFWFTFLVYLFGLPFWFTFLGYLFGFFCQLPLLPVPVAPRGREANGLEKRSLPMDQTSGPLDRRAPQKTK
jgi:hypothetical protein